MIRLNFFREIPNDQSVLKRRKLLDGYCDIPDKLIRNYPYYQEYFNEVIFSILEKDKELSVVKADVSDRTSICHNFSFGGKDMLIQPDQFIEAKLKEYIEKNVDDEPSTGDIILYVEKPYPVDLFTAKHSGIVVDGRLIKSKWGAGGVVVHKVFDVPIRYGSYISYFKAKEK